MRIIMTWRWETCTNPPRKGVVAAAETSIILGASVVAATETSIILGPSVGAAGQRGVAEGPNGVIMDMMSLVGAAAMTAGATRAAPAAAVDAAVGSTSLAAVVEAGTTAAAALDPERGDVAHTGAPGGMRCSGDF